MKTKNCLSRFSAAALLAAALIPAALTSCSSDSEPNPVKEDPIPEGMARINLTLGPSNLAMEQGSRALSDNVAATSDESKISTLWLYIFKSDKSLVLAQDVSGNATDLTAYREILSNYNLELGSYKIYVLANIEDYLLDNNKATGTKSIKPAETMSITEDDITGLKLKFNSGFLNKVANLPMASNCTDVTVDSGTATVSSGTVTLTGGAVSLKANLTFLCSAVRFTYLFDPTTGYADNEDKGFSSPYRSFEYSSLTASKLSEEETPLFGDTSWSEAGSSDSGTITTGYRADFPTNLTSFTDEPYKLDINNGNWPATSKIAYQGIVYLPENCNTTDKTEMTLAAKLDNMPKTFTIKLPNNNNVNCDTNTSHTTSTVGENILKRGHYYDVIGKITGAGMTFQVKIKKWENGYREVIDF